MAEPEEKEGEKVLLKITETKDGYSTSLDLQGSTLALQGLLVNVQLQLSEMAKPTRNAVKEILKEEDSDVKNS
jgi:hypothetical protein